MGHYNKYCDGQFFDGRLPFILNTIGDTPKEHLVHRDPGPCFNQFIWVKEGAGKFEIAGETHILGKGEGMFMRSGIAHKYSAHGAIFHTVWCTFFAVPSLVEYCIGDKPFILFNVPDSLDKETEMLTAFARKTSSILERSAAGYSYVTNLFTAITKKDDDVIDSVRRYLEHNCHRSLTLDDIAGYANLDRYALCRYFRQHLGISPMEELKRIRIRKAKRLLCYSSDSIEDIGKACGFSDPSYFGLKVREECGCTPKQYRKSRM